LLYHASFLLLRNVATHGEVVVETPGVFKKEFGILVEKTMPLSWPRRWKRWLDATLFAAVLLFLTKEVRPTFITKVIHFSQIVLRNVFCQKSGVPYPVQDFLFFVN
jgi:hypothetical protein